MKIEISILSIILCLLTVVIKAQNITTKGKEFYVSFFRNAEQEIPAEIKIFLTSSINTTGNITNPNTTYNIPFSITAGGVTVITIPFAEAYNSNAGIVNNLGLVINAADTISAYALSSEPYSSDAALLIQTNALGNDYLVASYRSPIGQPNSSCLLIEATEDNTNISIIPSVKTSTGNAAGVPFNITLNRAQTYYLRAQSFDTLNADLSGTRVSVTNGCKPIAVFAGNDLTFIPDYRYGAGDILYEQMFPISSFGRQFITPTLKGRNVYRVKVYAPYDNTNVNVDGNVATTITAGKYFEFESLNQPKFITTSQPVQVAVFGTSESYDNQRGPANDGDPTMFIIPPLEQQLKESVFLSPAIGVISLHKVSIVCKTADAGNTLLDGVNVGNAFTAVFGNPLYSYAAIDIAAGQHKITNNKGFIAYSYGFGVTQGYGYCTGSSVEKINTYFTCNQTSSIGNPTIDVCTGISVFDIVTSETNNTIYSWDFGDGSPVVNTNGTVLQQTHNYPLPGIYIVTLTTTNGIANACSPGNTSVTQLTLNVQSSLIPSLSLVSSPANPICIGSFVNFVATPTNGGVNPSYQWKLNGINVGTDSPTFSRSNLANNDVVSCTVTGSLLCASNPTATASLTINLSAVYAPNISIATASNVVCIGFPVTFTAMSLGPQPAAQYQWKINGINAGSNSTTFTYTPTDGDIVSCVLTTSNNSCGASNSAVSNTIVMSVVSSVNASINITESNNPACTDSAVVFTASPINGGTSPSYQWQLNGNNVGTNNPIYTTSLLKNNDVISCIMTSNFSCVAAPTVTSNSITMLVHSVSLGNDTAICEDQTKLLDATYPNSTYLWQDGSTLATYTVTQKGNYRVRVSMPGCVMQDTVNIDYLLKPRFTLGEDKQLCLGNTLILKPAITNNVSSLGLNYLWQDGSTNPTYTATQAGLYRLELGNLCGSTSDEVNIIKGVCNVYVPNAFSPNGDTKNDVFKIGYGESITEFQMQVYNRYGQLVFKTNDKSKGWDGNVNGKVQQLGTYTWGIRYKTFTSGSLWQEMQGTVILLR